MLDKLTNRLLTLSVIFLIFIVGFKTGQYSNKFNSGSTSIKSSIPESNEKDIDFNLFWTVWNELEKKFVDQSQLNTKKMYYGAIKGMVASVGDPYTFFLTPEENKQRKEDLEGKIEGIGAQFFLQDLP